MLLLRRRPFIVVACRNEEPIWTLSFSFRFAFGSGVCVFSHRLLYLFQYGITERVSRINKSEETQSLLNLCRFSSRSWLGIWLLKKKKSELISFYSSNVVVMNANELLLIWCFFSIHVCIHAHTNERKNGAKVDMPIIRQETLMSLYSFMFFSLVVNKFVVFFFARMKSFAHIYSFMQITFKWMEWNVSFCANLLSLLIKIRGQITGIH